MDEIRREELKHAFRLMTVHNLWRRGKTDDPQFTPKEIGEAIDTLCGAALDCIVLDVEMSIMRPALNFCEEHDALLKKENRRLRALLAAHHIKYKPATAKP